MYLSYLQLRNFRNFPSSSFIFKEGTNTILGENDSGKSNAITALRILLDDTFFFNTKRLRESDFSYNLTDWRGHWIIISATFNGITNVDKTSEIAAAMVVDDSENVALLNSLISGENRERGVATLFIRPQRSLRRKLFEASGNKEAFNEVRQAIRLVDYELYFTTKSKVDFCNNEVYSRIAGDLDACIAPNPEDDDSSILGHKMSMSDVQNHISLVYVDALRDVLREMNVPRNPIRRIIEAVEGTIDPEYIDIVKENIRELNESITDISQIGDIGSILNHKLLEILGLVYSPEITLISELSDEINRLSRFIAMRPNNEDELDLLGLGHLNMIYLALKIVEFEICRSRELLNIMVIEEPEAHIHSHIQKTLFKNLSVAGNYTQVIMTTHSVHLAESSEISRMNILKTFDNTSIAMQPTNGLDYYGTEKLNVNVSLTNAIERYLDAKRSVLLFSKSVVLVEGDAEEILLPHLVKKAFGITLDEIGIGLVNISGTSFEYIASIFHNLRIQRFCAIVTDLDKQAVDSSSKFYLDSAEQKGEERKNKLIRLYGDNKWVDMFYADHTFEVELLNSGDNYKYFIAVMESVFKQEKAIQQKAKNFENLETRVDELFSLLDKTGKGWGATILSGELDCQVDIPMYLVRALAFSSQESMSLQIYKKILTYALSSYPCQEAKEQLESLVKAANYQLMSAAIHKILQDYKDDIAVKLICECEKLNNLLVQGNCYD